MVVKRGRRLLPVMELFIRSDAREEGTQMRQKEGRRRGGSSAESLAKGCERSAGQPETNTTFLGGGADVRPSDGNKAEAGIGRKC